VVVVGGVIATAVIASSGDDTNPNKPEPNPETPRSRVIIGVGE
jgi:hypothetical protein